MHPPTPLPLATWENFYVIAGTSAGALTGLQFVVMTLIAQARAASSMREIRAFGTPTVIHFCTSLLISALATAPWENLSAFAVCIGVYGALGVLYSMSVVWHARKAAYSPDLEDWFWYTALPLIAHLLLAAAAIPLWSRATWPLSAIAADTLLFLLIGIHNSWDTVTYVALKHAKEVDPSKGPE